MEERLDSDSRMNVIDGIKSNRSKVAPDTEITDEKNNDENDHAPALSWVGVSIAKTMDDAAKRGDGSYLAQLQSAVDPKDPAGYISLCELPKDRVEHAMITKLRDAYVYELDGGMTQGHFERECEALAGHAGRLLDGLRGTSREEER